MKKVVIHIHIFKGINLIDMAMKLIKNTKKIITRTEYKF